MKTVEILGANRFENYTKTREGSRAVIVQDGKILLTHELNSGWWLIPGGGTEEGETPEECVVREVEEETGYLVRPLRRFLAMREYYEEYRYSGYFFICEVTGKGQMNLTDAEKRRGVHPEWIPLQDAIDLFSKHESYADVSEEKRGSYQREYMALTEYMNLDPESPERQIYERFPGVSCSYRDAAGREILKYDGLADKENDIPVEADTVFPACSISKFITAITVIKLQEQDQLDIDEPVNRYLHEWKLLTPDGQESDATIRSILSHTAGIVDGEDSFYGLRRSDPVTGLTDILEGRTAYNNQRATAEKQPGTEFEYSDAGYCVLQLMIAEITHCSFEEAVGKYVFAPLHLKKTFFASLQNIELREKDQKMASGYDNEGSLIPGKYPQVPDLAASGLWSTPGELMVIAKEFIEAVNGRSSFLRRESAQEMIRPAANFSWVGLGLFRRGDDTLVMQGWGENGQSMIKMNHVTGEVSVVMTNRDPGADQTESGVEQLAEFVFYSKQRAMNKTGGVQIREERISAEEYIDFLKRTDLGSQYPRERFEERIRKLVKNVSISLIARNEAGLVVGALFGLTDYCYWLYVTDLGVDRDYLKQGIATRLMKTAHELAGGEKDIAVYLIANEDAVPFYEKIGMKKADDVMQYNHIEWTEWTV